MRQPETCCFNIILFFFFFLIRNRSISFMSFQLIRYFLYNKEHYLLYLLFFFLFFILFHFFILCVYIILPQFLFYILFYFNSLVYLMYLSMHITHFLFNKGIHVDRKYFKLEFEVIHSKKTVIISGFLSAKSGNNWIIVDLLSVSVRSFLSRKN